MLNQVSSKRDVLSDNDHERIEDAIEIYLEVYRELARAPSFHSLLSQITSLDKRLKRLDLEEAKELLQTEPSIIPMLQKAFNERSFREVRRLEILWPKVKATYSGVQLIVETHSISSAHEDRATEKSWNIPYVGTASKDLFRYLTTIPPGPFDAKYVSIVQSSGMGKSRAVDELSKDHLVVPVNFRNPGMAGFPAADVQVRDWLCPGFIYQNRSPKLASYRRAGAFLCALFVTLLQYLRDLDQKLGGIVPPNNQDSLASKFRLLMTTGQTFSQQGPLRRQFYKEVVEMADKLWVQPKSSNVATPSSPALPFNPIGEVAFEICAELQKLIEYITEIEPHPDPNAPVIIIAFDAAHALTDVVTDNINGPWSNLTELQRALRYIYRYRCVSIFLSATEKDHQVTRSNHQDISADETVGEVILLPPFCELGFDQLADPLVIGSTTLSEVSSEAFMAKLGRPLFASRYREGNNDVKDEIVWFAIRKLLCAPFNKAILGLTPDQKMACISVRLPLDLHRMSLSCQLMQKTLVEKHMRVCLSVDTDFEAAITIAPSEPLLALASYIMMAKASRRHIEKAPMFDLPRSLLVALEDSGLDKGERGELVGMVLCLQARDAVAARLRNAAIPVIDFIRELLPPEMHEKVLNSKPARSRQVDENRTLQDTFCASKTYFTHFLKLRDRRMVNRKFLLYLVARGAAACCGFGQTTIDIIIPYTYRDEVLKHDVLGAFFVQVRNDVRCTSYLDSILFDLIDPYDLKFFDNDETDPVPIIRVVFALASDESCVEVRMPTERKQPVRQAAQPPGGQGKQSSSGDQKSSGNQPPSGDQPKSFTAFDIWWAGVSKDTFPLVGDDEDVYRKLLLRPDVFPSKVYNGKRWASLRRITRNMNPGTDADPAHYEMFVQQ